MTKQEIIDYMYKNHVQGDFKIEEMAEDLAKPDLQPTCNNLATDTISRQAAIDAVEFGITYAKAIDVNTGDSKELFKEGNDALRKAVERLKDLPSAEPKTSSNGSITCMKPENTHDRTMGDLIRIEEMAEDLTQPEIIRCKDCKHWMPYDWMFSEVWQSKNMEDYPEDEMGCDCCDMNMGADDYCSRAELRGEEE